MTIEEAIEALEFLRILDAPELSEAVHMAINALRAQQEAEQNEPLTLEELREIERIYPLTVIADRYTGCYSGGKYAAWNKDAEDIPEGPYLDDVGAWEFWEANTEPVGIGDSPVEAIRNLWEKINRRPPVKEETK